MQRSVPSQIYGYVVCLLAIVVALASLAGLVNSAFRAGHPGMGTRIMIRRAGADRFGGPNWMPSRAGGPQAGMPAPPQMREAFAAGARSSAIGGMVTHLILLLAAAGLFFWHWRWLHGSESPREAPASTSP